MSINEGWTLWHGGDEPPLPAGTRVDIVQRDGTLRLNEVVGEHFAEDWEHEPEMVGQWPFDIFAYKTHEE